MIKKLTASAAATAAAITLTACGTSDGEQESGTHTRVGPDLSGQQIEVAGVWSGEEQQAVEDVLALFAEQTGAEVTYTSAGDDLPTVLQTRVDGKTPPNVAFLPQPGLIEQFAAAGSLEPLSDDTVKEIDEHYVDFWKDLGTVDGKQYAVYFKVANKSIFWYNQPLFDEVGATPPESINDLIEVSGTLADNGIPPLSVAGADGWVLTDWFENLYLQTAGPEMYDKLSKHEIKWTDKSVEKALTVMRDVLSNDNLAGGTRGALQTDFPTSVSNVFATDPKAAMVYEGDFVGGVIASSTDAELGVDANAFPFPLVDGASPSVVTGGDGAVAFTDDEATQELMKFLASPEAAEVWASKGGFLSPNGSISPDTYSDDLSRQFAKQLLDAGDSVRFDMSDLAPAAFGATKGAGQWKDLQDFLADPDDIKGAMARLEKSAAAAF